MHGVLAVVERDAHLRQSRAAAARHEASSPWGPWRSQGLSRTQVGAGFAGAAAVTALAVGLRRYANRERPIGPGPDTSRRVSIDSIHSIWSSIQSSESDEVQSNVPQKRMVVIPLVSIDYQEVQLGNVQNAGEIRAEDYKARSPATRLAGRYALVLKEFADACINNKRLHLYLPVLSNPVNKWVPFLDSRAFYDAYDVLVYGGVVSASDLLLSNITILAPRSNEIDICRREFGASERTVTYVGGFTNADRPKAPKSHPVPLDGPVVRVVGPQETGEFADAGVMRHASGAAAEYASLKNVTMEEKATRRRIRDEMDSAGLPWSGHKDAVLTDLLALHAGVAKHGISNPDAGVPDARGVVVRVVRDMRLRLPAGFSRENTLARKQFFLYVREDAGKSDADHVASVCAGFDAMIREDVSVAIIFPCVFSFGKGGEGGEGTYNRDRIEAAQGIVKSALQQLVPHNPLGAAYSAYITTAVVVDESEASEASEASGGSDGSERFGGVELYTVP